MPYPTDFYDVPVQSRYLDGTPIRGGGETVMVDHHTQTFTVTVRTLIPISTDNVTALLQRKYEVTHCAMTERTEFVHDLHRR